MDARKGLEVIEFIYVRQKLFYCVGIVLFITGSFIVPNIPVIREKLEIKGFHSFFSGVSLAGYWLTLAMLFDFLHLQPEKILGRWKIKWLTIALFLVAVVLHPILLTGCFNFKYDENKTVLVLIYAFFTSLASLDVYLLGVNVRSPNGDEVKAESKSQIIRFLILTVTLVSLMSIAITFVLGISLEGSHRRAIIFSSYCLVPLAAYALGYLAKLIDVIIVKGMAFFLSVIFGFLIGMITTSIMRYNNFIYPANLISFIVIGFLLVLESELKGTPSGNTKSVKAKNKGPSIQDSLTFLTKALEIASQDSKKYYLKTSSEVSDKKLKKVDASLVPLSQLVVRFGFSWLESRRSGPDAVEVAKRLEDRIDIKLVRTGNLDFEQFKKITVRLNRADDALYGLKRIDHYISYYKNLCKEKRLKQHFAHAELFQYGVLNQAIETIERDAKTLTNQIGRCNLYYQNVLNSKTFKIAFISLFISIAAVLLSIISVLLTHGFSN